ncbi:MAG: DUF763 domain-containing protein [Gemmatimonadota bacterium]
MARRSGTADLPLHGGRAPRWLFDRMERLAPAVVEAIVLEHGPGEVLARLSDPWWFQAFGCVLGFDWHSSGVTTTVCGALKSGLKGRERDTGIWVAGGKGRTARKTPSELLAIGARTGLDAERLVYSSRLSAKVDTAAVQDGFGIYHHSFFVTGAGEWAVVQQGMRPSDRSARRYHWLGARVTDMVREPHAGIASERAGGRVLDLTASASDGARAAVAELAREEPDRVARELDRLTVLEMPRGHAVDVRRDVNPRHLRKIMLSTYEAAPANFEALLGVRGMGAKGIRSLVLLAELLYGTPASTRDPARFSFAHGGKDGHPFPVDRATYDRSIDYLKTAVGRARVGRGDRVQALKRLAAWEAGHP